MLLVLIGHENKLKRESFWRVTNPSPDQFDRSRFMIL